MQNRSPVIFSVGGGDPGRLVCFKYAKFGGDHSNSYTASYYHSSSKEQP